MSLNTIIATIKPVHLGNIRRGIKRYEIRKTFPVKERAPVRVLLCESGSGGFIKAEFVCDYVVPVQVFENGSIQNWEASKLVLSCISYDEMAAYIGSGKVGFAWHITDMIDYCNTKGQRVRHISEYGLKRPPQSWQYVKEE
jgi:predicted transcriptional regulator